MAGCAHRLPPTPEEARALSLAKIRAVLRAHRVRSVTAEEVHETLQKKSADGRARRHCCDPAAHSTASSTLLSRSVSAPSTRDPMEVLLDELERPPQDGDKRSIVTSSYSVPCRESG